MTQITLSPTAQNPQRVEWPNTQDEPTAPIPRRTWIEGRCYVGTLEGGTFVAAGATDRAPLTGEHIILTIANDSMTWEIHGVGEHACYAAGGPARIEPQGPGKFMLVLDDPDRSGGSSLVPESPCNPDVAMGFLAGLMTGLPKWPFEVVLPPSMRG